MRDTWQKKLWSGGRPASLRTGARNNGLKLPDQNPRKKFDLDSVMVHIDTMSRTVGMTAEVRSKSGVVIETCRVKEVNSGGVSFETASGKDNYVPHQRLMSMMDEGTLVIIEPSDS